MKKIIIMFFVMIYSALYAGAITPLTDAEKENINKSNPVFNRYSVGSRLQNVETRFSDAELSDGLGYTPNLAVASYKLTVNSETISISSDVINETPTNTITAVNHGLTTGDALDFNSDSTLFEVADKLIDADSIFYAIRTSANVFKLATSRANALAGTVATITHPGTSTIVYMRTNRVGTIDLGVDLPDNAIILESYIEPITSTNASCSVAIGVNSANDIRTSAILVAGTNERGLTSTGATPTIIKTAAVTPIIATFADVATSAEFKVYITYVVGR